MDSYKISRGQVATANGWRNSMLILAASVIMVLVLFRETAWSILLMWRTSTYSYGFLVLPSSLCLIWASRGRFASLRPAPNPWALALLGALGFGWLLADLGAVQVVKQLTLVGMLPGLVWAVLGTSITRRMVFPLAFLFFLVPVGYSLVPPLQDFTALFAVKALELVGVPVVLEGRLIYIPSGTWEVAQACAGLRYLIASMVLGCLYAYFAYRTAKRRIAFLLACMVIPILANAVRAFGIVLLGHLSDNRLAVGVDHLIYGSVFFALIMFLLFSLGWRWREPGASQFTGARQSSVLGTPPRDRPQDERGPLSSAKAPVFTAAGGVALLVLAPLSSHILWNRAVSRGTIEVPAPPVSPPWKPVDTYAGHWWPSFFAANAEVTQTYVSGPKQVHLYLAYYASEQPDAKLVSSENVLFDEGRWKRVAEGKATAMVDGKSHSVHEIIIRSAGITRLVWTWYWVGDEFTNSAYRVKLLQAKAKLFRRPQGEALVALAADYAPDRSSAAQALQDFLLHTYLRTALHRISY